MQIPAGFKFITPVQVSVPDGPSTPTLGNRSPNSSTHKVLADGQRSIMPPPKAPEGWRTPRRFAPAGRHREHASVLDCASPPPLFPGARLCEPQHVTRSSRHRKFQTLLKCAACCGSQTRAPSRSEMQFLCLRLLRGLRATGFVPPQLNASRQNLMALASSFIRSESAGTLYSNSMVASGWATGCRG